MNIKNLLAKTFSSFMLFLIVNIVRGPNTTNLNLPAEPTGQDGVIIRMLKLYYAVREYWHQSATDGQIRHICKANFPRIMGQTLDKEARSSKRRWQAKRVGMAL